MSSSDDTIVVLANFAKVNPDAALNALRGSKYKDGSELAVLANLAKVNPDVALNALRGYASSKKAHYSRLGCNRQRKSADTVTPEVPVEVPVTPATHPQRMSCWIKTCDRKCGRLHEGDDGWVPPPLCRNGKNCPTKDDLHHPCMFRHPSDEDDDRKPKDLDIPLDWRSVRNAIGENSKQQKATQEKLAETQEKLAATQKKLAEMQSQFEVLRQGNIDLEERLESLYELTQGLINKVSQLDSEMNIVMVNQPIDDTDQLFAEAIQQDQDKNSQHDSTSDSD